MSKARITYEIIAGVLSICTIGGTTAMCVPNSQTKIADYTAENLSPKYAQIMELTKEQQEQIKNLEIEIDENGKIIIDLNSNLDNANKKIDTLNQSLNSANDLIKDKDSQITTLQNDKATLSNEITSLTNQKAQVQSLYEQGLITIEERDSTIATLNSQINAKDTLIEQKTSQITTLKNEKQQLQTQVDELTNQKTQLETDIVTLTQEKTTLQAQVSQLKQDKAELQNRITDLQLQLNNYNFFELHTFEIENAFRFIVKSGGSSSINTSICVDSIPNCVSEIYTSQDFGGFRSSNINPVMLSDVRRYGTGTLTCSDFSNCSYITYYLYDKENQSYTPGTVATKIVNKQAVSQIKFLLNGKEIDDINSLSKESCDPLFVTKIIDDVAYVYLFTPNGKYVSASGDVINFDSNSMTVSGVTDNMNSVCYALNDDVSYYVNNKFYLHEQTDGSLLYNGITFIKQTSTH